MVQERKHIRNLLGILKDKTSLVKIALSIKSTSVHVAIIHATAHSSPSPPPDHYVAAVLTLGNHSRHKAATCVAAIMDRLHKTRDAYVALKCLFTLHQIITRGSEVMKEQLAFYPSAGGRNFLNLSMFRDGGGSDMWQLSEWVRWYASVLEHNLMVSRELGTYFSSTTKKSNPKKLDRVNSANSAPESISDLIRETDALVSMVGQISHAPESLHYQRIDLVYEIVNSVGEDYRSTQHQIRARLSELGENVDELSLDETTELVGHLEKLEECRERLKAVFVNRKRNDAFWDMVRETKVKAEEGEKMWWLVVRREVGGELSRGGGRVGRTNQVLMLTNGSQRM